MGLMQDQQQAPAQRDPATLTDSNDENATTASPEEQQQYSMAENNLLSLIYEKGNVRPGILEALKPSGEKQPESLQGQAPPPEIMALSTLAVEIVSKLDDSAREAGQPLSNDVLAEIAQDSIEHLSEVSEASGQYDYSEDEMAGALTVAVDMYREKAIADGRTSEEELKGEFDGLLQADKSGDLKGYTGVDVPQK